MEEIAVQPTQQTKTAGSAHPTLTPKEIIIFLRALQEIKNSFEPPYVRISIRKYVARLLISISGHPGMTNWQSEANALLVNFRKYSSTQDFIPYENREDILNFFESIKDSLEFDASMDILPWSSMKAVQYLASKYIPTRYSLGFVQSPDSQLLTTIYIADENQIEEVKSLMRNLLEYHEMKNVSVSIQYAENASPFLDERLEYRHLVVSDVPIGAFQSNSFSSPRRNGGSDC